MLSLRLNFFLCMLLCAFKSIHYLGKIVTTRGEFGVRRFENFELPITLCNNGMNLTNLIFETRILLLEFVAMTLVCFFFDCYRYPDCFRLRRC